MRYEGSQAFHDTARASRAALINNRPYIVMAVNKNNSARRKDREIFYRQALQHIDKRLIEIGRRANESH